MTEARHDHAVSLLTAASPTIALLLEREAGGPRSPSPPPRSPPPPPSAVTPVVTATPGDPGPLRLAPSLLAAALEGPYPVEVRPVFSPPPPPPVHTALASGRWYPGMKAGAVAPGVRGFTSGIAPTHCGSLHPQHRLPVEATGRPIPNDLAAALRASGALCCPMGLFWPLMPFCPQEICLPRAGGPLGLSIVGGSDHSSHPFGVQEPGVFISKVGWALGHPCARRAWPGVGCWAHQIPPSSTGAPTGPGCPQWPSGRGPHPRSERAGRARGHTPGGGQRPAPSLPGVGPAGAEGPATPRHAGALYPESSRGEAGHQHPRGRQGPCGEPL